MARVSIPVGFVTGFLGSGKTTLIQRALAHPSLRNTAVIVNEFGEVGLDHLLMANAADTIIELRNGCICCTIHQDLTLTLRDLYTKRTLGDLPRFDYVLVETTGLADPGPLLHTLTVNPIFRGIYHPDAVITCVDQQTGAATIAAHSTAADQVALADILVLTKSDLVRGSDGDALRSLLDSINPSARRLIALHGAVDPDTLFRQDLYRPRVDDAEIWMTGPRSKIVPHRHHQHDHAAEYASHTLRHEGRISLPGALVFLDRLAKQDFGTALRVKGLASFRERDQRPALVQGVQGRYDPMLFMEAWPDADHATRLVIIGRALDTARIDHVFDTLCR